ncbi:MAG TPA: FxSxx-COOH system tetratricopeptide repeat protein [Blastocatellia bacterium]|nr:FxSxx-COOH system tetratricopeptide repeat protein [Blastocatellia bacterium]
MKDFFISYTSADRHWAEWIAWQLEDAEYSVELQAWDFDSGDDFIARMNRVLKESDRTLAVLTPRYFESRFTEAEWSAAFAEDKLLPVRVVDFDVKGLLSSRAYIDLAGKKEEQAKETLLAGVKTGRRKPEEQPAFPPPVVAERVVAEQPRFPGLPAIWNVPQPRNLNFVGRDDLLDRIRDTLTSEKAAALTAVHGLGGVGKTQLAAEYAYRHAADYDLVWWIKSEEPATLASDYGLLAAALDLPQKHEREQPVIVAAVRAWLNHNGGWLLVFDNARKAQDVREYLPQNPAGHVLITSRDPIWGNVARPFEVKELRREDSIKFLLERTGQNDESAAGKLAEQLGDLPLALEQAGAYIETNSKPLAEYLSLFERRRAELLRGGQPAGYPDTVATTWQISFREVEEQSPAAAALLNLCTFLAPDDIPLSILRDGAKHLPETLAEVVADEMLLDDAIAALRRYSLLERSEDGLSVHRLVQIVACDRLADDERKKWAEASVRVVNAAFPKESDDVRTWAVCGRLLAHALAAAGFGESLELAPEATGRLLNQAGLYFRGRAQYAEGKQAHERALRIDEAAYGPDHPDVATDVNNLGLVLQDLGELAQARQCYERALRIDEAAYGPDHPEVATDVNNLGLVLQDLGELAQARQCFERALRIGEASLGADHTTVATYVNNLGEVLRGLGELVEARQCYERALRVDEAAFGPDHPNVARDVNNLGLVLKNLGELEEARRCYERALRIEEAAYGPDHPIVATHVNNLGGVLQALGDLEGARVSFERALRIREAAFGLEHPNVAVSVWWLGTLMEALDDPDGARQCYERALQIFLKFLGSDHPTTVKVRNFLAALKAKMG